MLWLPVWPLCTAVLLRCVPLTTATAAGTIRLAGDTHPGRGRVEIYYNDAWGTICDDKFDSAEAFVVCKQLGYEDGVRLPPLAEGSGPIWLDQLGCSRSDPSLDACSHKGWGVHDCTHLEDAAVQCQAFHLVETETNCYRVTSESECSIAGQSLGLADTTASNDGQTVSDDPPYCYFESGYLKFNGGGNTGPCTASDKCLCWLLEGDQTTAPTRKPARGLCKDASSVITCDAGSTLKSAGNASCAGTSCGMSDKSTCCEVVTTANPTSNAVPTTPTAVVTTANPTSNAVPTTPTAASNDDSDAGPSATNDSKGGGGGGGGGDDGGGEEGAVIGAIAGGIVLLLCMVGAFFYFKKKGGGSSGSSAKSAPPPVAATAKTGTPAAAATPPASAPTPTSLGQKKTGDPYNRKVGTPLSPRATPPEWESTGPDFNILVRIESHTSELQQLLDRTYKQVRTRDRGNAKMPTSLQIVLVQRNENRKLWQAYCEARAAIKAQRHHKCTPLSRMGGEAVTNKELREMKSSFMYNAFDDGVNEVMLWHGTSPYGMKAICSGGFKMSTAGSFAGTMYGPGAYFAECSSKSDEYARDDSEGGAAAYPGMNCLLLCRLVLGEILWVQAAGDNVHGTIEAAMQSGSWNSVLGDRQAAVGTYREFVVYGEDQIYPEYAIIYQRMYDESMPIEAGIVPSA